MYIITDFTKFIILLFSVFKPLTNNGGAGCVIICHLPWIYTLWTINSITRDE